MGVIYPDRSKKAVHHPLLAIDFENDIKTGEFICAYLYGYYKDHHGKEHLIDKYFDNIKKLEDYLLSFKTGKNIPFWLIGFNWGYDHVFINDIIDMNTLFYANSRFITARLKNGIKLIDLCNHVDGSLKDWIEYLDMKKKYGIEKKELSDLKERVKNDAMATYYLGRFVEDFYVYECGVSMKLTVGATALSIFRKRFLKHVIKRDNEFFNNYERNAYYGGRVEIFKKGYQEVYSYDVNSMYLSIMRDCYIPVPSSAVYKKENYKYYLDKYLGIFHVQVEAPQGQKVMCLPYRDEKVIYPCGIFEGYYTSVELKEALKHGYKILHCYDFVYYTKKEKLFKDYAEWVWNKRKEYKKKGNLGMELLIKKLGNSLYGKFGQRNEKNGYWGLLSECEHDLENRNFIISKINGVDYIALKGDVLEDSNHTFVCISAFISAYARLKLFKMLKRFEDWVVYCDTDSIKYDVRGRKMKSSDELGGWSFEYRKKLNFIKSKAYGDKIKGIPRRAIIWRDDKEIIAIYNKPNRFKESIRRRLIFNKWDVVERHISLNDDKREWISDDVSYPLNVQDLERQKFEKEYAYVKKRYKAWYENLDDDLVDYEAYHDSTLTKHENKEILKRLWKDYSIMQNF